MGKTGLKLSRLGVGTGSRGGSIQRALGADGFGRLINYVYDQGITSLETMFLLPATITRENYETGEKYYACGWGVRDYGNGRLNVWHTGSLPGCYTFMARWSNGVNCVVLFNKRVRTSMRLIRCFGMQ